MGTIHSLGAYESSGLRGIQVAQRDWSPFVAHFTSYAAMGEVRLAIRNGLDAPGVAKSLAHADEQSISVVRAIEESGFLRANSPSTKDNLPECVCFSECSLPGLLGHCERYGRFGWVFRKSDLYQLGARPCTYVDQESYAEISRLGKGKPASDPKGLLFGLSNLYSPPGSGKVQDFTHEREWRLFRKLDFEEIDPVFFVAPARYSALASELASRGTIFIPIDLLHEWGL